MQSDKELGKLPTLLKPNFIKSYGTWHHNVIFRLHGGSEKSRFECNNYCITRSLATCCSLIVMKCSVLVSWSPHSSEDPANCDILHHIYSSPA